MDSLKDTMCKIELVICDEKWREEEDSIDTPKKEDENIRKFYCIEFV